MKTDVGQMLFPFCLDTILNKIIKFSILRVVNVNGNGTKIKFSARLYSSHSSLHSPPSMNTSKYTRYYNNSRSGRILSFIRTNKFASVAFQKISTITYTRVQCGNDTREWGMTFVCGLQKLFIKIVTYTRLCIIQYKVL